MAEDDVTVEVEGSDASPATQDTPEATASGKKDTPEATASGKKGKKGKKGRSKSPEPAPAPRTQVRQQSAAQAAEVAKAPGKRQRFRVDKDHKTVGPRGITKLAAGSLVTEATHDLVQLAEEGAILTKL